MNAGEIGAAAEPFLALLVVPQRAHELPARPAVGRAKEPAGNGAAPEDAGLLSAAGFERPDLHCRPRDRLAPGVGVGRAFGLFRIGRRRALLPGAVGRRPVHLDAEVAVIESGVEAVIALIRQHHRDMVGEKVGARDAPARRLGAAALQREQALAGCHKDAIAHRSSRSIFHSSAGSAPGQRL